MKHHGLVRLALTATSLLIMIACTDDRVQKQALKYEVYPKSMIDSKSEYLYVPSTLSTSRHTTFGRAYLLGDQRIVKMELEEFALNVYAVDKEKKFANNPSNKRLVMSIPVEHVDYRCADDAFGECLSEEIENDRLPWDQKKHFRPKFEDAKLADANFLPSDLPDGCYNVKETKLSYRKLEPNAINFRLERNYQNELFFFCNRNLNDIADLNWSDVSHYSIVKLDAVASADYEKVNYHPEWINTFGFFEQNDNSLDIDGNTTQSGEIKYISRWNPKRKAITYFLSPEFNKMENKVLKAATLESFKRINAGLQSAGIDFRISLKDADETTDIGDLRNSMIILAEDPFEASVIGYGPSITHPRTGEILSARTVMYAGSLKKFIRYTYDEILRIKNISTEATPSGETSSSQENTIPLNPEEASALLHQKDISPSQLTKMIDLSSVDIISLPAQIDRTPQLSSSEIERAVQQAHQRDQIALLSKNNMYPAEMLSFGDISQDVIEQVVKSVGQLQSWEKLSDGQKQAVLDVLTPYVWVPTLIHEVGHNLGLRHNFSGSEDKDNFYSQKELAEQNLPVSSKNVPYSSIMDYPKSEINALRAFGKYDIAALRFGYTLKAIKEDGTLASVNPNIAPEGLKSFSYCSDEGIAPNPNCNPFDEGSGFKAIAESLIESYKENYERSNFRRGRAQFSSVDDDFYYSRISRTFNKLRLFYERYEDLVKNFQLDQATIDSVEWLKDLDEAVVVAADFLMSVVAEPDTLCIIGLPDNSVQAVPIGIFSELAHNRTRSCFALQLNEGFSVLAQGGKHLNSLKLPDNPNRFADQIDVRGTWIDKAIAMKALFQRKLGSSLHDDVTGNFMNHPKVTAKLEKFLAEMLNDQTTVPVNFTDAGGNAVEIPLGVSRASDVYEIRTPELPIVSRALGLKYDNLHLLQSLTSILRQGLSEGGHDSTNAKLLQSLSIKTNNPNGAGTVSIDVGSETLYAQPSQSLAHSLIQKTLAGRQLEASSTETVQKVFERLQKQSSEGLNEEEKKLFELGLPLVQEFIEGRLAPSRFYEPILLELAEG